MVPSGGRRRHAQHGLGDGRGPGPGGVDQRPRGHDLAMAAIDRHQPPGLGPVGTGAARAGADRRRPALAASTAVSTTRRESSTTQSEYSKAVPNGRFSAIADRMVGDVDGGGARQMPRARQPVVQQQPGPQLPRAGVRRHGREWQSASAAPDAARSGARRRARPAPRGREGSRRRSSTDRSPWISRGEAEEAPAAEVALLQQDHAQAAAGGIARDADAVQPAADDRKIVVRHTQRLQREPRCTTPSRSCARTLCR